MRIFILLCGFVALVTGQVNNIKNLVDYGIDISQYDPATLEDAFLTTPQLATKYGYNAEIYTVTTCDGYILEMHRIQSRLSQPNHKAPIFLMHGLLGTSDLWVLSGKNNGLAYLLADLGYDVWMGNTRGTYYSRKHINLNPDGITSESKKYWSFSWHEIGIYDLPAMIDKVLEITGYNQLQYIGFSQGTTAFWVMASELPKYNDKIITMHALAPVAFLSNKNNAAFGLMAMYANKMLEFSSDLPLEIPANSDVVLKSGLDECTNKIGTEKYECFDKVHLFKIGGYNSTDQINTKIPVAISHIIGGAAVKCFKHYEQLVDNGKFSKFDYGRANFNKYRKSSPPEYKLKNISTPVALYYTTDDEVTSTEDIQKLIDLLPNVFFKSLIENLNFSHTDYRFSPKVVDLVYNELIKNLQLARDVCAM